MKSKVDKLISKENLNLFLFLAVILKRRKKDRLKKEALKRVEVSAARKMAAVERIKTKNTVKMVVVVTETEDSKIIKDLEKMVAAIEMEDSKIIKDLAEMAAVVMEILRGKKGEILRMPIKVAEKMVLKNLKNKLKKIIFQKFLFPKKCSLSNFFF